MQNSSLNHPHSVRRRHPIPKHRLERSKNESSSSSMDEDENSDRLRSISVSSTQSNSETGHRRRRRRKPKSGSRQRLSYVKNKAMNIEKALIRDDATDSLSSSTKDSPLVPKNREGGKEKLRELAISEGGLLNDDFRRKVWPRLLDIDMIETTIVPSDETVKSNKNYNQVLMDVNRSLKVANFFKENYNFSSNFELFTYMYIHAL